MTIQSVKKIFFTTHFSVETNRTIFLANKIFKNLLVPMKLGFSSAKLVGKSIAVGIMGTTSYIITKVSFLINCFLPTRKKDMETSTDSLMIDAQTSVAEGDLPIKETKEMGTYIGELEWAYAYIDSLNNDISHIISISAPGDPRNFSYFSFIELKTAAEELLDSLSKESQSKEQLYDIIEKKIFPELEKLYKLYIYKTFSQETYIQSLRENISDSNFDILYERISFDIAFVKILTSFAKFQKNTLLFSSKKELLEIEKKLEKLQRRLKFSQDNSTRSDMRIVLSHHIQSIKEQYMKLNFVEKNKGLEGQCPSFLQQLQPTKKFKIRESIMRELLIQLNQKELGHTILIGEAGAGKSALLEILAERLPSIACFNKCVFYKLNATNLESGTNNCGSLALKLEQMRDFFTLLKRDAGIEKIFVVIDEIHQLTGMGTHSKSSIDIWQALKEDLGNSEYIFIGTTTTEEYEKIIMQDGAVASRFTKITVPNLTEEEKTAILESTAKEYLNKYDLIGKSSVREIIVRVKFILAGDQIKQNPNNESSKRELMNLMEDFERVTSQQQLLDDREFMEYEKKLDEIHSYNYNVRDITKKLNYVCSGLELQNKNSFFETIFQETA